MKLGIGKINVITKLSCKREKMCGIKKEYNIHSFGMQKNLTLLKVDEILAKEIFYLVLVCKKKLWVL